MTNNSDLAFLSEYSACFSKSLTDASSIETVRFVVLDTETTGLDPRRDRLITIGAVAVKNFEIVLSDSFEALLKIDYNRSSVTVHGVTRQEALEGGNEADVLALFLAYLKDGVIVGHHILHDIETVNCALERNFGTRLENRFLDTMDLTLHLEKDGAFEDKKKIDGFSLDALCEFFGIAPHDRHTAGGDAFITALVFLRLLRTARNVGRTTLGQLCEAFLEAEEPRTS